MGERLSLFHLVSLLLVLGISLDYSLFFGREGDSRETRVRTAHALSVCALSTIGVFALLTLSSIPVLDAIGKTVGIGTVCGYSMAFALSRPLTPARC
jgi:predicted exporter